MYKILEKINTFLKPYYFSLLVIFVVIIFIIVSYFAWKRYVSPQIKDNKYKDVANINNRKRNADIYFFYTDWCPHCTKAKDPWKKFKEAYNGRNVNNYSINCIDINCTDDIDGEVENIINTYKIDSYPTIKMTIDGDETIEYDAKISFNSLETFINTILN